MLESSKILYCFILNVHYWSEFFCFRHKGGLLNQEALPILTLSAGDLILPLSTGLSQAGKSIYFLFWNLLFAFVIRSLSNLFGIFVFVHVHILTLQLFASRLLNKWRVQLGLVHTLGSVVVKRVFLKLQRNNEISVL